MSSYGGFGGVVRLEAAVELVAVELKVLGVGNLNDGA